MLHALRVHAGQGAVWWQDGALALGILELGSDEEVAAQYAPVTSADGTLLTWLVGEVYEVAGWTGVRASASRGAEFRRRVAAALERDVPGTLRSLDGEFVLLQWNRRARTLAVWGDRFGSLPTFHGVREGAHAIASGVRGVLASSTDAITPDLDAIREAVSYGGFRLGARTNVEGVRLLPAAGALVATAGSAATLTRWWHWRDLAMIEPARMPECVESLHQRWQHAIETRLEGATRPAQTLSGGLDSRAILAEAAPRAPHWAALTYGVRGCDDARYAEQAARVAGVDWTFQPLYRDGDPAWLDERLSHVQHTDGLIELGDLMHAEALPWMQAHADTLVSGYIGDAVIGPTFNAVTTPDDLLDVLPYYGDVLGEAHGQARARAAGMLAALDGAPPRFALFDDKLPQSTNFAHGALWRPYVRVRRPFLAHALFDFAQGLPTATRGAHGLQAHWLRSRYPAFFARIPNQKTGLPVGATAWRHQAARGQRLAGRAWRRLLAPLGLAPASRIRSFTNDAVAWRASGVREAIGAVLRAPDALHHAAFAPGAVARVLEAWERRGAAPAQVIGALVVFEHYHRGVGAHRTAAQAAARTPRPPAELRA